MCPVSRFRTEVEFGIAPYVVHVVNLRRRAVYLDRALTVGVVVDISIHMGFLLGCYTVMILQYHNPSTPPRGLVIPSHG